MLSSVDSVSGRLGTRVAFSAIHPSAITITVASFSTKATLPYPPPTRRRAARLLADKGVSELCCQAVEWLLSNRNSSGNGYTQAVAQKSETSWLLGCKSKCPVEHSVSQANLWTE